jgi:hypothetical protein
MYIRQDFKKIKAMGVLIAFEKKKKFTLTFILGDRVGLQTV